MASLTGQLTWVFNTLADYTYALSQLLPPVYTNVQSNEATLTISVTLNDVG